MICCSQSYGALISFEAAYRLKAALITSVSVRPSRAQIFLSNSSSCSEKFKVFFLPTHFLLIDYTSNNSMMYYTNTSSINSKRESHPDGFRCQDVTSKTI